MAKRSCPDGACAVAVVALEFSSLCLCGARAAGNTGTLGTPSLSGGVSVRGANLQMPVSKVGRQNRQESIPKTTVGAV